MSTEHFSSDKDIRAAIWTMPTWEKNTGKKICEKLDATQLCVYELVCDASENFKGQKKSKDPRLLSSLNIVN